MKFLPTSFVAIFHRVRGWNWRATLVVLATTAALYFYTIPYLKTQVITSSEGYTFANVPIEFALYNKFHYPIHAQSFYFPGIDVFVMSGPLYFIIGGFLLKILGVGVWQILLPTFSSILLIILLVIGTALKFYDYLTAIITALLCMVFNYLSYMSLFGRPDPLLGLTYALFLLTLYYTWSKVFSTSSRQWLSFIIGVLATTMVVSHWQGVFAVFYFPVHLFIMYRQGESWLRHGILLTLGSLVGFAPWAILYMYYGENPITILRAVYLGNGLGRFAVEQLRALSPFRIFYPIQSMPGGWAIGLGAILFLTLYLLRFIKPIHSYFQQFDNKPEARRLDLLLLWSLIGWFIFYYFLIINRQFQYLSNVLFPLILISARGYALSYFLSERMLRKQRLIQVAFTIGVLVFAGNYLINNLNFSSPFPLQRPNTIYNATRQALQKFVTGDYALILGIEPYHYLYDYKYISNVMLEANWVENQSDLKNAHPNRLSWGFPDIPLAQRQELVANKGQIAVIPDEFGMFQKKFFDRRIWQPHFKKVASIFSPGRESAFPIYYRQDIAHTLFENLHLETNTSGCVNGVLWLIYDPWHDMPDNITGKEWQELTETQKEQVIFNFFEYHQWFGQRSRFESLSTLRDSVIIQIDQYFTQQEFYENYFRESLGVVLEHRRTIEEAMDDVINRSLRSYFCSEK